tara:strand:+ start:766 stop:867 length:102 start_codon:yes stop_codon:yes gene_type:complete
MKEQRQRSFEDVFAGCAGSKGHGAGLISLRSVV